MTVRPMAILMSHQGFHLNITGQGVHKDHRSYRVLNTDVCVGIQAWRRDFDRMCEWAVSEPRGFKN